FADHPGGRCLGAARRGGESPLRPRGGPAAIRRLDVIPDPITLLGFIFILGALIFIHESGHYFMAKALGIRVEVFSLGFGPKLLRFQKGGTEYCISALPVGGYVKMLGENPDESQRGSPDEFQSRSKGARLAVLVMGAALNIVLAVVLMSGLYMHGVP